MLLGNFDSRPKLDSDIQKMLAQKFGKDLFTTVIHRSVKHREANVYGQTIFEHAAGQQAAEQFQALARGSPCPVREGPPGRRVTMVNCWR